MKSFDIKRGDILVVTKNDSKAYYDRDYVTFIANGRVEVNGNYVRIQILAAVDLAGILQVREKCEMSITYNTSVDSIFKATIKEYTELAMKLEANGYKFDKKAKKIKKLKY